MAVVLSPAPVFPGLPAPVEAPRAKKMAGDASAATSKPASATPKGQRIPRGKRERPCDACRKRKSKCVVTEGRKTCAACGAHGQECTYVEDPQPRKRRVDADGTSSSDSIKRRSTVSSIPEAALNALIKTESAGSATMGQLRRSSTVSSLTSHNSSSQLFGTHIGPTTEIEPLLLNLSTIDSAPPYPQDNYQNRGGTTFLVDRPAHDRSRAAHAAALAHVESLVGAQGPHLLWLYLDLVQPNFPIIEQGFFADYEADKKGNIDPALLAAIFAVTVPWLEADQTAAAATAGPSLLPPRPLPDAAAVDDAAFVLFADALHQPTLSTLQAGLLLMQRPHIDAKVLNSQLVGAAHELGLQVDCAGWERLRPGERGLRKRLAWALYMQDKWCSLIHGRPSAIYASNWTVQPLADEPDAPAADFPGDGDGDGDFEPGAYVPQAASIGTAAAGALDDGGGGSASAPPSPDELEERYALGREIFRQMVALTQILTTVLDTFYTLRAMRDVAEAGPAGTRLILDRAKPVQIRLKAWFGGLPAPLKMDAAVASRAGRADRPAPTGSLHLAYFATEITLHRCIIRSFEAATPTIATPTATPITTQAPPLAAGVPRPPSSPRSPTSATSPASASSPVSTSPHSNATAGAAGAHPSPNTVADATTSATGAPTPTYLAHICRAAAKTRLISAMDFANRLRPAHLRAFWYFPSRVAFALVGAFGALLLATSPCAEEARFYATRLGEYRWTLGVSARVAPFLAHAARSLDSVEALLRALPPRPRSAELGRGVAAAGGPGSGVVEQAAAVAAAAAAAGNRSRSVSMRSSAPEGGSNSDVQILDAEPLEVADEEPAAVSAFGEPLPALMEEDAAANGVPAVVGPSGPSGLVSPSASSESRSTYEAFVGHFAMEE